MSGEYDPSKAGYEAEWWTALSGIAFLCPITTSREIDVMKETITLPSIDGNIRSIT